LRVGHENAVLGRRPASAVETIRTGGRHRASRPRRADAASRRPIPAVPDWLRSSASAKWPRVGIIRRVAAEAVGTG
jgi:phage terminase small subunit